MPTFILRAIDPDLWSRVTAKAAADGISVKQLVLKALAQYVALVALLFTAACGSSPTASTVIPAATPAAANPAATGVSLSGALTSATGGKLVATVTILDGPNAGRATVGSSDAGYRFDGLVSGTATLSATAPTYLTTTTGVVIAGTMTTVNFALQPAPVTPAPSLTPPVPPGPPQDPAPPNTLKAAVTCSAASNTRLVSCNLTLAWGLGTPVDAHYVTRADWDWADGSVSIGGALPVAMHPYGQAGTYRIDVAIDALGPDNLSHHATATTTIVLT
jgi:hypothetical protein